MMEGRMGGAVGVQGERTWHLPDMHSKICRSGLSIIFYYINKGRLEEGKRSRHVHRECLEILKLIKKKILHRQFLWKSNGLK